MFTLSSFKKLLIGVTSANVGVVLSCFYVFKKNRPLNDKSINEPSENFRIKTFDELAKNYDEKNDFIEKITSINKYKKKNFRKVHGVVLEIGAGTGRNFSYLKNIEALVCVEKSVKMCEQIKKKLEKEKPIYPVYVINNDIKNSLFKSNVFDCVISSFTLCSFEHVDESLQKVLDIMKQNGKFYLIERGIIYNKIIRYILEKLDLYPNRKIPWEYGYYENRDPLNLLKKNNFNIVFKLIKNAGSIYIITAKKHTISLSYSQSKQFTKEENNTNTVTHNHNMPSENNSNKKYIQQTVQKKTFDIDNIICQQKGIPIYYYYKNV
ncbi:methyltransferase [Plasmodium brasilianum]|uniref:Methyltransferase, putative n=2 Tax=Plasmodium (Plasmodium) TaxID=418103 RepID=A0A1A8X411_PLAMA|nr:methyltransferase, putative [Plasmodium malariae]KAI4840655.1 methyltransferase [Plasmodium brasilianum]SBS98908.1 methyltransferase, putative [Plasmodium malariae]SBT86219.1 methyltransferase, putative [Plasmodium malariae]